jgi:uncharacterized protein (DUF433 family)
MARNYADIEDLFADDDEIEDLGYKERIVQDPAIMVGKPVVRGTRIPVEVVLGKFACDLDLDELFAAYPELTIDDVKASLAFARASVMEDYRRSRSEASRHAAKL